MPTAAEHRAEASSLTAMLDTVGNIRTGLRRDRDDVGVHGGSTWIVVGAIDASVTDLDELGRQLTALVDELHRRAALCDQYTADLQRYEDAHRRWELAVHRWRTADDDGRRWPGPEPVAPAVPFAGAVAG